MSDEEDVSLYLYALGATGVIVASIWLLTPQQIEVARLSVDAVATGAIDTATIPRGPEETEPEDWNPDQIAWRSYEDGMRLMAETGKQGVMVLQAEWCLVCRSYQKLFHEKEVERRAKDFVFILADIDRDPALQRRYDVDGDYIPRTFLLNQDGTLAKNATSRHERQRFFVDPFQPDELLGLLSKPD